MYSVVRGIVLLPFVPLVLAQRTYGYCCSSGTTGQGNELKSTQRPPRHPVPLTVASAVNHVDHEFDILQRRRRDRSSHSSVHSESSDTPSVESSDAHSSASSGSETPQEPTAASDSSQTLDSDAGVSARSEVRDLGERKEFMSTYDQDSSFRSPGTDTYEVDDALRTDGELSQVDARYDRSSSAGRLHRFSHDHNNDISDRDLIEKLLLADRTQKWLSKLYWLCVGVFLAVAVEYVRRHNLADENISIHQVMKEIPSHTFVAYIFILLCLWAFRNDFPFNLLVLLVASFFIGRLSPAVWADS